MQESPETIAAATKRLQATLHEMRVELEYTRQLADLARMTSEVRALASELAATQRAFLDAERLAASQELAGLHHVPAEPPTRVSYRPLPSRDRAPVAAPPAPPDDMPQRMQLVSDLIELRGQVERIADPVRKAELGQRLERFGRQLADPQFRPGEVQSEMGIVRALVFNALKPVAPAPVGRAAPAGDVDETPVEAARVHGPRVSRSVAPVLTRAQVRGSAVVLAGAVALMVALLLFSNRRSPEVAPASSNAGEPVAPVRPVRQAATPGVYRDPQGLFECVPPAGWKVSAQEVNGGESRVRFQQGADEILVISHGTQWPALQVADQEQIVKNLVRRLEQTIEGELYTEVSEAHWEETAEAPAIQVGLRLVMPTTAWRALAINYRQHGRDHKLCLIIRSQGNEAALQAAFQQFVFSYHSTGAEAGREPGGEEVPFLRGVVADLMNQTARHVAPAHRR